MEKIGKDLTSGNILSTLMGFAFPFFMSNLLQSLYGATDMFVVGRFCGASALSAVNVGTQIMQLVTFIVIGIGMGGTVMLGQSIGQKDQEKTERILASTMQIFISFMVILTPLMTLFSRQSCRIMLTPPEALDQATTYVRICSMGIPCIICFHVLSSILRGLGDSKTPMIIVAIAATINIAGDIVLTGVLGMGVSGVAIATISAQAISSVFGFVYVARKGLTVKGSRLRQFDGQTTKSIFRIGIPLAAQDTFITVSFMFLTAIANSRGLIDSSAVGVTEKLIMFMFLVPGAMLNSVSAITSQNYGAGKLDRARTTTMYAISIIAVFGCLMVLLSWTIPEQMCSLFSTDQAVVQSAAQYLRSYSTDTICVALVFGLNGYLCGIGRSMFTFIHSVISVILVRIPAAFLLSRAYPDSLLPMGWASPMASLLSCVLLIIYIKKTNAMRNV